MNTQEPPSQSPQFDVESFFSLLESNGCDALPNPSTVRWAFEDPSVSWIFDFLGNYLSQSYPVSVPDRQDSHNQPDGYIAELSREPLELIPARKYPKHEDLSPEYLLSKLESYTDEVHLQKSDLSTQWRSIAMLPDIILPKEPSFNLPELSGLENSMLMALDDPDAPYSYYVLKHVERYSSALKKHLNCVQYGMAARLLLSLLIGRHLSVLRIEPLTASDIKSDTASIEANSAKWRDSTTWISPEDQLATYALQILSGKSQSSSYTPFSTLTTLLESTTEDCNEDIDIGVSAIEESHKQIKMITERFKNHNPGKNWVERVKRKLGEHGKRATSESQRQRDQIKRQRM